MAMSWLRYLNDIFSVSRKEKWNLIRSRDTDWFFGILTHEIKRQSNITFKDYADGDKLKPADVSFFVHVSRLIQYLSRPSKKIGTKVVLFTHYESENARRSEDEVLNALKAADRVVFMSKMWEQWAIKRGLSKTKCRTIPCGADPNKFRGKIRRGDKAIGFVSRYYPGGRKNHETIFALAKRLSDQKVLIIGPRWEEAPDFKEVAMLPNVYFIGKIPYSLMPNIYAQIDVFVNVSKVEGGPMPLLEAMLSNCWPISTRVGFAEEIIKDGKNGYLLDTASDVDIIEARIRSALKMVSRTDDDVRRYVINLTWQRFVQELHEFVRPTTPNPLLCPL